MVEFQQEPGDWNLNFGIATSDVLSLGMKSELEHAHSALWVEFKELLKWQVQLPLAPVCRTSCNPGSYM